MNSRQEKYENSNRLSKRPALSGAFRVSLVPTIETPGHGRRKIAGRRTALCESFESAYFFVMTSVFPKGLEGLSDDEWLEIDNDTTIWMVEMYGEKYYFSDWDDVPSMECSAGYPPAMFPIHWATPERAWDFLRAFHFDRYPVTN